MFGQPRRATSDGTEDLLVVAWKVALKEQRGVSRETLN